HYELAAGSRGHLRRRVAQRAARGALGGRVHCAPCRGVPLAAMGGDWRRRRRHRGLARGLRHWRTLAAAALVSALWDGHRTCGPPLWHAYGAPARYSMARQRRRELSVHRDRRDHRPAVRAVVTPGGATCAGTPSDGVSRGVLT